MKSRRVDHHRQFRQFSRRPDDVYLAAPGVYRHVHPGHLAHRTDPRPGGVHHHRRVNWTGTPARNPDHSVTAGPDVKALIFQVYGPECPGLADKPPQDAVWVEITVPPSEDPEGDVIEVDPRYQGSDRFPVKDFDFEYPVSLH